MAEQVERYTGVEARHQAVRALVEQQFPGRFVQEITERARTLYRRSILPPQEHVLAALTDEYEVIAHSEVTNGQPGVRCTVVLEEDGTLRITRQVDLLYFRKR